MQHWAHAVQSTAALTFFRCAMKYGVDLRLGTTAEFQVLPQTHVRLELALGQYAKALWIGFDMPAGSLLAGLRL